MSTYVREKVLRVPMERINMGYIRGVVEQKFPNENYEDEFYWYLEAALPHVFDYAKIGKFQIAPTVEDYIDYILDYE